MAAEQEDLTLPCLTNTTRPLSNHPPYLRNQSEDWPNKLHNQREKARWKKVGSMETRLWERNKSSLIRWGEATVTEKSKRQTSTRGVWERQILIATGLESKRA